MTLFARLPTSGRDDIALYTGNDDTIVADLLTPYRFAVDDRPAEARIVGGLLGHWAVWTERAVALLEECHSARRDWSGSNRPAAVPRRGGNRRQRGILRCRQRFAGCIAGIHEVLRRQGLLSEARDVWTRARHSALIRRPRSIAYRARTLI